MVVSVVSVTAIIVAGAGRAWRPVTRWCRERVSTALGVWWSTISLRERRLLERMGAITLPLD